MNIEITPEEAEKRARRQAVLVHWQDIKAKVVRILCGEEECEDDVETKLVRAYEAVLV